MDLRRDVITAEIAAVAARFVVDEGLEYAAAKRRAVKQMGLPARTALPDNATLDAAVREDIAVFCADTQPVELRALRERALVWMDRLEAFRPHLGGAVWQGTATRHSDIYIQLFCDDPKAPEWALLDHRVEYHPGEVSGWRGEPVQALSLRDRSEALGQWVLVHLMVHAHDDMRGALKPDAQGRKPRGDATALRRLMAVQGESGNEAAA
ncbi:hypothetical protein [Hydrogenophaga sp. IBVHS1]|uniref:hypothetical protein n=1 Tax=unclassified Hydrogenophaga TaxID=2610897 RepID=UPI000A2E9A2B|nr:hypothetical protein [Hydrogenophaga sp. IBVHS1]OSZ73216.1 hypothetical protein CAP37_16325 [Hydrogenophaga sp. IBVHS1]